MSLKDNTVRFSDAEWYAPGEYSVLVGGVGGIGSWLALYLARLGTNLNLFDMDTIDQTNLGGQLYQENFIGKNKGEAMAEIVRSFCGEEVSVNTFGRFDEDSPTLPIMFSAFDNMNARKLMFENWLKMESFKPEALFMDGRMRMEYGEVFCVTKDTAEQYREEYLFDDAEVVDDACSAKSTSHCGGHIASIMTAYYTNHITNIKLKDDIRTVPFKHQFFFPIADYKLEELTKEEVI